MDLLKCKTLSLDNLPEDLKKKMMEGCKILNISDEEYIKMLLDQDNPNIKAKEKMQDVFINYLLSLKSSNQIIPRFENGGLQNIIELKYILTNLYIKMSTSYLNSNLNSKNTIKELLEIIPLEADLSIIENLLHINYKLVKMNSNDDLIYKLINIIKTPSDRGGLIDIGIPFFANFFDFNIVRYFLDTSEDIHIKSNIYKLRLTLKENLNINQTLEEADKIISAIMYPVTKIGFCTGGGILSIEDMLYSNSKIIYEALEYLNEQIFLHKVIIENSEMNENGYICKIDIPLYKIPRHIRFTLDTLLTGRIINCLNLYVGINLLDDLNPLNLRNYILDFHKELDKYHIPRYIKNMFNEYEYKISIKKQYDSSDYAYSIEVYNKMFVEYPKLKQLKELNKISKIEEKRYEKYILEMKQFDANTNIKLKDIDESSINKTFNTQEKNKEE